MQLAEILSDCLGRKIEHVKLTGDQRVQRFLGFGMPEHYANFLTFLETSAAKGAEERMNDAVEELTGRPPQTFGSFAQQNKLVWE
jgi:hypothetical protein